MRKRDRIYRIIGIAAITSIGIVLIPPLIKEVGNRLYKCDLKNDVIDYESMEPEIVKKADVNEEDIAE